MCAAIGAPGQAPWPLSATSGPLSALAHLATARQYPYCTPYALKTGPGFFLFFNTRTDLIKAKTRQHSAIPCPTQPPAGHHSTPTPCAAAPATRTRHRHRAWANVTANEGAKDMSCGPSEAVVTIDRWGPVNGCQREIIRSSDRLLTCGAISNALWPSGPCDGMRLRHSG